MKCGPEVEKWNFARNPYQEEFLIISRRMGLISKIDSHQTIWYDKIPLSRRCSHNYKWVNQVVSGGENVCVCVLFLLIYLKWVNLFFQKNSQKNFLPINQVVGSVIWFLLGFCDRSVNFPFRESYFISCHESLMSLITTFQFLRLL